MGKWIQKRSNRISANAIDDQSTSLTPLDDTLEWEAHAFILERLGLNDAAIDTLRTYKDIGTTFHMPKNQISLRVNESL